MKIKVYYRRGFIYRVELTTEMLMGRVCPNGGSGSHYHNAHGCELCVKGRIPGIAAKIGACVPVTQVVLTDCPCWRNPVGEWTAGAGREHNPLPPTIWEEFVNPEEGWPFKTQPEAEKRLWLVTANECRKQAGLHCL